jgi:hypothetical protein
MKVFFAVSPRALKKYQLEYRKIYYRIEALGHENINDVVINVDPVEFYQQTPDEVQDMYIDLTRKLRSAEIVIIDATIHSLAMGFYIKMAVDLDKPTIILHQPDNAPFFFQGIQNERLQIVEYTYDTIEETLKDALEYAKENLDIRFNLFIAQELNDYLKWVAKKHHMPRSNFVRNLIMDHKKANLQEYEADLKK